MKILSKEHQRLKSLEAKYMQRACVEERKEEEVYDVLERSWSRRTKEQKRRAKDLNLLFVLCDQTDHVMRQIKASTKHICEYKENITKTSDLNKTIKEENEVKEQENNGLRVSIHKSSLNTLHKREIRRSN